MKYIFFIAHENERQSIPQTIKLNAFNPKASALSNLQSSEEHREVSASTPPFLEATVAFSDPATEHS